MCANEVADALRRVFDTVIEPGPGLRPSEAMASIHERQFRITFRGDTFVLAPPFVCTRSPHCGRV